MTRPIRLFIISVALMPCILGAQVTATGFVTGTVRDEVGRPVRDALVVLDAETTPMRTRTTAEGKYRIDRVPVGGHELQVVRIGFRPHRSRISIAENGLEVDVTLNVAPMLLDTIAVRVSRTGIHGLVTTRGISLLPHDPRPLRGAIVEVLNTPFRTTTSTDGRFNLDEIGEGAHSLLVRIDRYQSRIVSAYVPPEGGLDLNIVLDSTIADWQRRDDMEMREISSRIRAAGNPSAFVSAAELTGPEGMSLKVALREAPSALSRGLLTKDDVTCVYLNGEPRPGMTVGDFKAEEIYAVEVYGLDGRGRTQAPVTPWPKGTFCGTGRSEGPGSAARERTIGEARRKAGMSFYAMVVVIWTKRGR